MPFVDVDEDGAPLITGGYAHAPADRPSIWLEEDDPRWVAHLDSVRASAGPDRLQLLVDYVARKADAPAELKAMASDAEAVRR